ncbi:MAG: hypothetical protein IJS74_02455 [Clostridia bacterium]|nr:hypothetical protein [Clostridia bacterium]
MINPCYLVKRTRNEDIEHGLIVCKAEKNIVQNLRMPDNNSLIWVTENKANEMATNSRCDLVAAPTIKRLFIMHKHWQQNGRIIGYIDVDEFYKLDRNSLKNYEKGIYIYLTDPYSARVFTKNAMGKNTSDQIVEETIKALPRIPLKGDKLDFTSLEREIEPGM